MYKKLCLSALTAFVFVGAAQADTFVVDFANQSTFSVDPYEVVFTDLTNPGKYDIPGSGFQSAGSSWVAFRPTNPNPGPVSSFTSTIGNFSLDSLFLAAAWGTGKVEITGYAGGATLYSSQYGINTTGETFSLNWAGIDRFSITIVDPSSWTYTGLKDPTTGQTLSGTTWVLNGLTVTAVPEPESYAMLLAGLAIVGAVARRRRVTCV